MEMSQIPAVLHRAVAVHQAAAAHQAVTAHRAVAVAAAAVATAAVVVVVVRPPHLALPPKNHYQSEVKTSDKHPRETS